MLGEIINNESYIEIKYNSLVNMPGVIYQSRAIPKKQIVYVALEKTSRYVEVCLTNGEIFQIESGMFQSPSCGDNSELFGVLKTYL
jgi:hypothetical protein